MSTLITLNGFSLEYLKICVNVMYHSLLKKVECIIRTKQVSVRTFADFFNRCMTYQQSYLLSARV